ncbi:ankyrin repeat domain-containing protein [Providencia burhodogranariea]|uniref:Uncharacterized protein n=1 Tax=Providencia burhodogranariea DSM 19968 TaxID=1141662 RepID=K8WVE6_9GAMM|nr:ankyrin repeat domain-containing protein [Providencia burhodogranariea]EKT64568.1 hypothetical protein OOA_02187 [Providencia burhodogranariea DSM 19968]
MSTINQITYPQFYENEVSLIRETVNFYQRKTLLSPSCSKINAWPRTISAEQFWGRNPQSNDYLLGLIANGVYFKNWKTIYEIERLNHQQLKELGIDSSLLRDKSTGFEANICRYYDLYIISFGGSNELIDIYADLRQGLGYFEPQYFQAINLANILYKAVNGKMICTGHSLGGGLATFASIASQSPCISFTSAGVSANTLKQIGMDYYKAKKMSEDGLVRYYVVRYDWLDWLQSLKPAPPALGNKILLDYHGKNSSWLDWLPHNYVTRNFIAHSMFKILKMMCHFAPWEHYADMIYNDSYEQLEKFNDELLLFNNNELKSWKGCCQKSIQQENITEFSKLVTLSNKPVNISELVSYSVRSINAEFMKLLFDSSYASEIKKHHLGHERTYLHLTAQTGRLAQSRVLLKNNFAVNDIDSFGNTPLHEALNSHALLVAELLLSQGANWRIRNNQGYNCSDILNNHMVNVDSLSYQGKMIQKKLNQMMK